MREPARDLVAEFYPRATTSSAATQTREETLRGVRAHLGGPGVAVFEAMERVDAKERGRIASLVQSELRRLMEHRIDPVLPRSSRSASVDAPKARSRRH
jgi:hypothetical protein